MDKDQKDRMETPTVPASKFKEQCLALLDRVARTKVPIVVTKYGTPVVRVVPLEEPQHRPLAGSVTFLTADEEELFSTGEVWDAQDNGR
jgi:prevent-host-death family protein